MDFMSEFESAFSTEINDLADKTAIDTLSIFYSPEFKYMGLIPLVSDFFSKFKFSKGNEKKTVVDVSGLVVSKTSGGDLIFNYNCGEDIVKVSCESDDLVKIESSDSFDIVSLEGAFLRLKNNFLTKINSNSSINSPNLESLVPEDSELVSSVCDSRSFGVINVSDSSVSDTSSWIKVSSEREFSNREKSFYRQVSCAPLINSLFPKLKKYSTDSKIYSFLTLDDAKYSLSKQQKISELFSEFKSSNYGLDFNSSFLNGGVSDLEKRILFSLALFHNVAHEYVNGKSGLVTPVISYGDLKNYIPLDLVDLDILNNYELLAERFFELEKNSLVPESIIHNDLTKRNIIYGGEENSGVVFLDPIPCVGSLAYDLGKLPFSPFSIDSRIDNYLTCREFISSKIGGENLPECRDDFVELSSLVSFFNNSKKMVYSYSRGSLDYEFYKSQSKKSLVNLLRNN